MSQLRIRILVGLICTLPLAACAEAVPVAPPAVVATPAPSEDSATKALAARLAKASICADAAWKAFAGEHNWKYKLGAAGFAADRVPRDLCSPGSKVQVGVGLVAVSPPRFLQFRADAPQSGVPVSLFVGEASAGWKGSGAAVAGARLVTYQRAGADAAEVKAGLALALKLAASRTVRSAAGLEACGQGTSAAAKLLGAKVAVRRGIAGDGTFSCLWASNEGAVRLDQRGTLEALRDASLGKGTRAEVAVGSVGYYFPAEKVLRVAVSETELATVAVTGVVPTRKAVADFFNAVEQIGP